MFTKRYVVLGIFFATVCTKILASEQVILASSYILAKSNRFSSVIYGLSSTNLLKTNFIQDITLPKGDRFDIINDEVYTDQLSTDFHGNVFGHIFYKHANSNRDLLLNHQFYLMHSDGRLKWLSFAKQGTDLTFSNMSTIYGVGNTVFIYDKQGNEHNFLHIYKISSANDQSSEQLEFIKSVPLFDADNREIEYAFSISPSGLLYEIAYFGQHAYLLRYQINQETSSISPYGQVLPFEFANFANIKNFAVFSKDHGSNNVGTILAVAKINNLNKLIKIAANVDNQLVASVVNLALEDNYHLSEIDNVAFNTQGDTYVTNMNGIYKYAGTNFSTPKAVIPLIHKSRYAAITIMR